MRLKNRRIYGVDTTSLDGKSKQLYVNFGEGRYAYISYLTFFQNVKTWKGKLDNHWVNIVENSQKFKNKYGFSLLFNSLLDLVSKGDFNIKEKVVQLKNGSYLTEIGLFIPLKNGKIGFKKIKSIKGYQIKYESNGVCGFSIWKNNICLEDRIWSLENCKKIIGKL